MKEMIQRKHADYVFPVWPVYSEDEVQAVNKVLRSGAVNYWTGEEGRHFEEEYAAFVGVPHAIALANGSVALELALRALGLGEGDDVVVTSRSFIASASSIVLCGARPIFAEVDQESQNITASSISTVLTPETKAIIVVHLAGWPCEMDEILALASEKNIKVIEDCAQAHGATYKGQAVGSFGDAAVFSFCQDKIMSTGGEGGMLLVRDSKIFEQAWSYRDHGKSFNAVNDRQHLPGFRWLHESFGTNWRMTEMQAAIGRIQLRKLDGWVAKRQNNATILNDGFKDLETLRVTLPNAHIGHAYYKYYMFLNTQVLSTKWDLAKILKLIESKGIPCSTGSCGEIYMEISFQNAGYAPAKRFSIARELGETSLVFPVHPTLTSVDMENMVSVVVDIMKSVIV